MSNFDPILICPICKDLSNDPYECKGCNQTYCKDCTSELRNYCNQCETASGFVYSKIARKIINDTEVLCKFCSLKVKKGDMEIHYSNCEKYKLICKYPSCKFTGSKNDFFEHVIVFHKGELIDLFTREQHSEFSVANQGLLTWMSGNKEFVKKGNGKFLHSTNIKVKKLTNIKLKFSNCKDYNYCQIGFSSSQYDGLDKYLGGETGKESWGLAGNGVIGEEGKWNKSFQSYLKYSNEEITLKFNNGLIQVSVGVKGNTYLYNLGIKEAYLTVGLYHEGSTVTIISDTQMNK